MTITNAAKSREKPDSETLHEDPGYRKILELDFSDMIPFVLSNIRKPSIISIFYMALNTASLLFIIIYALWSIKSGQITIGRILGQFGAGIVAGSILVIPPHELLHGAAYRLLGARKIRFGMDLQQFIFYVTADRFPISRKELVFLALTPFIIINIVTITVTVLWASQITLFSASLLLSHNIMCIGDFAMINYAIDQKGEFYTYDDISKKRSYFYERAEKSL
jgi:hypothetical protein